MTASNKPNIQLLDGKAGNIWNRRGVELWNRDVFEASAYPADEMLMRIYVCVEATDGSR